jgi:macrolide-specific efflux system membrane fusion protein
MNKKIVIIATAFVVIAAAGAFLLLRPRGPKLEEVKVEQGPFKLTIASGGTVEPENKITITAPIAGRIDQIVFEEGARVRQGQVIAWMSSTDRAALLDSAKVQGNSGIAEWEDVYRPTPILSPTSGEIIAKKIVVGQTVNQQTELFQLSDRLIVTADVDETDLGKISIGQAAEVTVDSYPNLVVATKVGRIAHQSLAKNNINSYQVLLRPDKLPAEFRAGLTASIHFLASEKQDAILLPSYIAEGREKVEVTLQVKNKDGEPEPRAVRYGSSNGQYVEIVSGLKPGEIVMIKSQKVLADRSAGAAFGIGGGGGGKKK